MTVIVDWRCGASCCYCVPNSAPALSFCSCQYEHFCSGISHSLFYFHLFNVLHFFIYIFSFYLCSRNYLYACAGEKEMERIACRNHQSSCSRSFFQQNVIFQERMERGDCFLQWAISYSATYKKYVKSKQSCLNTLGDFFEADRPLRRAHHHLREAHHHLCGAHHHLRGAQHPLHRVHQPLFGAHQSSTRSLPPSSTQTQSPLRGAHRPLKGLTVHNIYVERTVLYAGITVQCPLHGLVSWRGSPCTLIADANITCS